MFSDSLKPAFQTQTWALVTVTTSPGLISHEKRIICKHFII